MLRKYKGACRRARRRSWRKFVEDTLDELGMSQLSRIIQHRQQQQVNFLERADGSGTTTTGEATIEELARKHFPEATPVPPKVPYNSARTIASSELREKYPEYVTPELTRWALRMFKPYKAPGPDGFNPVIFKHMPASLFERISFLY